MENAGHRDHGELRAQQSGWVGFLTKGTELAKEGLGIVGKQFAEVRDEAVAAAKRVVGTKSLEKRTSSGIDDQNMRQEGIKEQESVIHPGAHCDRRLPATHASSDKSTGRNRNIQVQPSARLPPASLGTGQSNLVVAYTFGPSFCPNKHCRVCWCSGNPAAWSLNESAQFNAFVIPLVSNRWASPSLADLIGGFPPPVLYWLQHRQRLGYSCVARCKALRQSFAAVEKPSSQPSSITAHSTHVLSASRPNSLFIGSSSMSGQNPEAEDYVWLDLPDCSASVPLCGQNLIHLKFTSFIGRSQRRRRCCHSVVCSGAANSLPHCSFTGREQFAAEAEQRCNHLNQVRCSSVSEEGSLVPEESMWLPSVAQPSIFSSPALASSTQSATRIEWKQISTTHSPRPNASVNRPHRDNRKSAEETRERKECPTTTETTNNIFNESLYTQPVATTRSHLSHVVDSDPPPCTRQDSLLDSSSPTNGGAAAAAQQHPQSTAFDCAASSGTPSSDAATNATVSSLLFEEKLKSTLDQWAYNEDFTLRDIRTLLSTLSVVLWDDHTWQPVSLSDLVMMQGPQLRKLYRTALLFSHPDRYQNAPADIQYRAHRIFHAVNESFQALKE